jgi:tRNA U34 5-methylaminomethyl-2-thiouridine-forming methyltransferase MnmC
VSFDLEKKGIDALLENLSHFPFAVAEREALERFAASDYVVIEDGERRFEWRFLEGDYCHTISDPANADIPPADHVFFDFFSPASHPQLWTYEVFCHLMKHCSPSARLYTYCCATRARANLLAAGFFVGFGIPSGKKSKTTIAARRREDLLEPLPPTFADTFRRSHIPFLSTERPELHEEIREKVFNHPQFLLTR